MNRFLMGVMLTLSKGVSPDRAVGMVVRVHAEAHGMQPGHPGAWGGVFAGPGWIAVGFVTSALKSNNARRIRVWSRKERGRDGDLLGRLRR